MDGEVAIEADGLTKRYGETVAVDDLSFSVGRGTVYGFLGPNGAGKTTTMRMLTTLTRPTAGTAAVAGYPISDRGAVSRRIGYLPEEPPLYDELTGREQLEYVAGLRDLPPRRVETRIDRLLDRFDLVTDADKRIEEYSQGMRQKVGVIQAILHRPEVVFLDEPTAGLDPRAARTMRRTIADLACRRSAVFLSTHILSVVEELADVIGVIHEGRLVAEGEPGTLAERSTEGDATLEDTFLAVTRDGDELEADPLGK